MALTQTQVSQLYVSVFGRASEGEGNTYWQTDQPDMVTTANVMLATDAATTYFGTSLATNQAFIEHIYSNTLGKTITDDPTGVAYWTAELDAGKTRGEVVTALVNAAVIATNAGNAQDQFNNKVEVSDYTATNIQTFTDAATFQGYISGVTHEASTVTAAKTSVDTNAPAATYTLAADVSTITEGSVVTFTVTASKASTADVTLNYQIAGVEVAGGTADPATDLGKVTGEVILAAGATTGTFTLTPVDDGSTEGFEGFNVLLLNSTLQTIATSENIAIKDGTDVGETYTLTTATDNIVGTTNNETIIGEFAASPANTLNASDVLNGGAGTDTVKMFGTYASVAVLAAQLPVTITNIEVLDIVSPAAGIALNFTSYAKATTGIETILIENASAFNNTITTTTGQSLSLATGPSNVAAGGTITWAGSATDTSLSLALNGYQGGAGVTPVAVTITGAAATTLNIASTGATNAISTLTGPTTVLNHVITGDQQLTYALPAADTAALNSIDASASTGGVRVTTDTGTPTATKATFTFTGGAGDDAINLATNNIGSLLAGTQLDGGAGTADKLGLFDTALTTAELANINAAQNFEILGLNAAVTVDASTLTSLKHFSLDTAGAQVITNMATGSTVDVTAAHNAVITLSSATGITDLSLNLGVATTTGAVIVGSTVTIGQTQVALTSNGTGTGTNTIATLANADNSTYTLTGNQNLTITNAIAGTSIGSKIDANAFTGNLIVIGSAQADVLIGGSGADLLNVGALTAATAADQVTGNGGADIFTFLATDVDTAGGIVTAKISDFTTGVDSIDTVDAAGSATNYVEATTAAASLAALLVAADAALTDTVLYYVGQVGSDTYLVTDSDSGTNAGYTNVIQLTGVGFDGIAFTDIVV